MYKIKFILLVILSVTSVTSLIGCAGGKTHESTGEYFDDSVISNKVRVSLIGDSKVKFRHISVETYKGIVQLSGFVNTAEEAAKAVDLARRVNGVKQVNNSLIVK